MSQGLARDPSSSTTNGTMAKLVCALTRLIWLRLAETARSSRCLATTCCRRLRTSASESFVQRPDATTRFSITVCGGGGTLMPPKHRVKAGDHSPKLLGSSKGNCVQATSALHQRVHGASRPMQCDSGALVSRSDGGRACSMISAPNAGNILSLASAEKVFEGHFVASLDDAKYCSSILLARAAVGEDSTVSSTVRATSRNTVGSPMLRSPAFRNTDRTTGVQ
mmetsp:Transcript_6223/g.17732  ORF Transcript_6223/g.17732 Transcript_6223/m.17732 type:complete len:223 (-) Transcript_6223:385-1053(-)